MRDALVAAWAGEGVVGELPQRVTAPLVVLVGAEPPALFARRLRRLAGDPALAGKLLAAWSFGGPLRQDLAASLLAEGKLAGIGLAEASLVEQRRAPERLAAIAGALSKKPRVEALGGPFLWHF